MGVLRKDPTRKQGFGTKTSGASGGLTVKGKVRVQDTGRGFGRGRVKAPKPIRGFGKGV